MVHFGEAFVGGWFGFGRTYGAVARFEYDAMPTLTGDWPTALCQVKEWRTARRERATALHLFFVGPAALAGDAIAFVAANVVVPADRLALELRGLRLEVGVFSSDGGQYLDVSLHREATTG